MPVFTNRRLYFSVQFVAAMLVGVLVSTAAGQSDPGGGRVPVPPSDPEPARVAIPQRIIATAPSNAEIVCALGAQDLLVGVSPFVTYPPELSELPKVGGIDDPDLEAVLALRPDLVIQRGRNPHLEALCRDHGIRIYEDRTDSLPSLYVTIADLGSLLSRRDQADELVASLRARLESVERAAADKPRPRALLTLRSPDRLAAVTTVAGDSYLSKLIAMAGGENIFGEMEIAYPQVSLEEIVSRQPEVIVEAMPGESFDEGQRQALKKQWEALGPLPAAKTGRIYILTEDYVLIPSPRAALLAEKLAALFHPPGTDGRAQ